MAVDVDDDDVVVAVAAGSTVATSLQKLVNQFWMLAASPAFAAQAAEQSPEGLALNEDTRGSLQKQLS